MDREPSEHPVPAKSFFMKSPQRIPHCSHWGAYTLLVDEGRIVGVEPFAGDPHPSPIIESVSAWGEPYRRVLQPMARSAWLAAARAGRPASAAERAGRGSDTFVPVSWDEALALVSGEIRRVIDTQGNRSVFAGSYGWTSCGRFHHAPTLLRRMMNLVGGYTGHVDTYSIAAGPVILRHVLGSADACQGLQTSLASVARHTETLVVFGAMSPRTAQNESGGLARHLLEDYLRAIRARGTRVIHVSPQRDDLPDWMDAEWWPIKPGTDTALMLALAGEIVARGRHAADFLRTHCTGSYVLLRHLAGDDDGVVKDAAWAARITGIAPERIRALAEVLPGTRSMLAVSWSLQRARHGEQPFWAALGLAAVIGQIGLPGGGVGYGYGSLGGVGVAANTGRSPAISQLSNELDSFIPVARITEMLESPGGTFTYEGIERRFPDTRLVYWAGGNPFHHHQDLRRLERAWRTQPETVIVQEPMWTATALRADIVLPATTSIERNDLAGNRRSDMIVAMKRAIAPLGQARSDFTIFSGLAARLGVADAFTEGRDEMAWLRHLYELTRADTAERFGVSLPTFDAFWEAGAVEVPTLKEPVYLAEYRADPAARPLATESGRIELASARLARWAYDDCPSHPSWLPPEEALTDTARAEGWLHLLSPQPEGRLHSQLIHAGPSGARMPDGRERLRMHADDAALRGLHDGALARVFNDRGACIAVVECSDTIMPGVVALPTGSWYTPGERDGSPELSGNANTLTLDVRTSRLGQGCAAHSCLVKIEPWADDGRAPAHVFDERLAALTAPRA